MAPLFGEYDTVVTTHDLERIDAGLTEIPQLVNLPRGSVGIVHAVAWNDKLNEYEYMVEFSDHTGTGLSAILTLQEHILQLYQKHI